MDTNNLHTSLLEKLFGPVVCEIIRQDDKIRIVHLNDQGGVSKTVGIVKFFNTEHKLLKGVHKKIVDGGLLGKTLIQAKIHFDKEFVGALQVKLPGWIRTDFATDEDYSVSLISMINVCTSSNQSIKYAELIEILAPEVSDYYKHKIQRTEEIEKDLLLLFESAEIMVENNT